VINYIEKGIGLHNAVFAAGHKLWSIDAVWFSDDDAAVQAIIDAYDPLPDQKADAIAAVKATGVEKIATIFPALDNIDVINLVAELYLSIAPAARAPTANFSKIAAVYTAAKNGIGTINAATSKAGVDAAVAGITWPF
jgi:hypothetical protein